MNKRATKREEEARRLLEDYRRELGPEYHVDEGPTICWADIYRDVDGRHDIEVLDYLANRRAGTNVVQVNLWLLPDAGEEARPRMLVNVLEVPNDPATVVAVSKRLAQLAEDEGADGMCVRCSYGQLDEVLGRAAS